jgi:hypothetical protein
MLETLWDIRYPHPTAPKSIGHHHRDAMIGVWNHIAPRIPTEIKELTENASHHKKGGRLLYVKDLNASSKK